MVGWAGWLDGCNQSTNVGFFLFLYLLGDLESNDDSNNDVVDDDDGEWRERVKSLVEFPFGLVLV